VPVRGFVCDAAVHDAVPFVLVEVRAGERSERVKTNVAGTFVTRQAFPGGALVIEVFDEGASHGVTKIERTPESMESSTTITIPIGPTFLVSAIGSRRVQSDDGWLLRIVQTTRPLLSAGEIEVRDRELALAGGPDLVWSEVPLRFDDGAVFARWAKVESARNPDLTTRVELRSQPRTERGSCGVYEPVGLQSLPDAPTRKMLSLAGSVDPPERQLSTARVLIRPDRDSSKRSRLDLPDFREVQTVHGTFELELEGNRRYSVLAWCTRGEPTYLERGAGWNGRHALDRSRIAKLLFPSFDPREVPPEIEAAVREGHQLVRARVADSGSFGVPIVDMWDTFGDARQDSMLQTRYELDTFGVDCEPATLGRPWQQILPGPLVPDRLPTDVVVRPHRIEWIDPRFENPRRDAHVTGAPGGSIVSIKDTTLARTWNVDAKCPLHFTVWKEGCEPVSVRSEDFVARGEEDVASVALRTGWGVAITFVVCDSFSDGSVSKKQKGSEDKAGPQHAASARFDHLAWPPLPGVQVKSPLVRGESDVNGWVLLRGPTWPDRLTLEAPGFRLRELREQPGAGARWIAYMEHDRYDP
jgi:hypothetical protein